MIARAKEIVVTNLKNSESYVMYIELLEPRALSKTTHGISLQGSPPIDLFLCGQGSETVAKP